MLLFFRKNEVFANPKYKLFVFLVINHIYYRC